MPKAGGAITTLASGLGGPRRIVADATHLYWTDDVDNTVMKVPIAGGAPTVLATGQMGANAIAVDATHVYWLAPTDLTVIKVAK
jgi:alpha-galactosidase